MRNSDESPLDVGLPEGALLTCRPKPIRLVHESIR